MAVQGQTRYRVTQIAKQGAFGSNLAATRRVPWRGPIVVNPNRTDADIDTGALEVVISPYNTALDLDATKTGPVIFNDLPYRWAGAIKGGVTPTGGTAKVWTFQAASLTSDTFEYFLHEWGDDVTNDFIVARDGVINVFEETMPEDLGPWTFSDQWIFGAGAMGGGTTGGLSVDAAPTFVFGADTEFKMDSTAAGIGTTKLTNALHGATFRITNNLDRKRFANGSNTRFQLANYGRGPRVPELILTMAKSAAAVTEANTLDDDPVPNRYFEILTTSPSIITGSTPYSYSRRVPMRLFSRADGEIGGNSTITLTYRGYYDATLGYAIRGVITNTLAAL